VSDDVLDPSLRCIAHGCPNRWSVDFGQGKLCSAHAYASPPEWPWISSRERARAEERATLWQQRSDLRDDGEALQ